MYPQMSRKRNPDAQYLACRICKRQWNVSKFESHKNGNYICPICRGEKDQKIKFIDGAVQNANWI